MPNDSSYQGTISITNGCQEKSGVFFKVLRIIPEGFKNQIEKAVDDFIKTHHIPKGVDPIGFRNQTFEKIVEAVNFGQGDFWLATREGKVIGYCLARLVKDVDNRLTYWISQAWLSKEERGGNLAKECWKEIEERAKNLLCSHIIIVSSRSSKAYLRFLGLDWNPYAMMLKKDI
jgi:hypothetical protein